MLIDPKGLFFGERLKDCSDEARLHWPWLYAAANGYGRVELNVSKITDTVYSSFREKPTPRALTGWIQEYADNFLIFVYSAPDGSLWGQFETSAKYLPKFKTQADHRSPAPDPDELKAFRDAYVESRKSKYLSIQSFRKFSKVSGNVPKSSEDSEKFPLGVGIGIGTGIGVGEEQKQLHAQSKSGFERVDASKGTAPDTKEAETKAQRVKVLTSWAEKCHAAYPRKVAKQDSLRAFIKHIGKLAQSEKITDDEAGARMLAKVTAYAGSPLVASTPADKIPYPASWVNAGHYEDPAEAWNVARDDGRPSSKPFEPGINIRPSGDPSQADSDRAFIEFARSQRDKGVISAHDLAVLNRLENSNTAPN